MSKKQSYILFLIVSTLWATISFILPDFLDNPINGTKPIFMLLAYLFVLGIATFFIILLGTIQKHIATIFLPLFATLGSVVAYYRVAYHATITPIIIEVTLQTNAGEVASVLSWKIIVYIAINIAISIALSIWRWQINEISTRWLWLLIGILGLPVFYTFNGRIHQSINQRYPYNVPYNLIQYYKLHQTRNQPRITHKIEVNDNVSDINIIVVIGEAIRADHLSINGYQRLTTPRLSRHDKLVNLGDVYSMHTHTSASLPHMLTPADTLHPDYAYKEESFIYYLKEAGYHTAWISNQELTDSYSHFAYTADTLIFPNSSKSVFVFDGWNDLDLLEPLSKMFSPYGKQLYILHTIGAHWYYNNHVAQGAEAFLPITNCRVVTENDSISVVNSYDNCVRTMDWLMDSIYDIIPNIPTVVIYQSDHGESLGEGGYWLHAAGAEDTKHPAGFIWYNEVFEQQFPNMVLYYQQLTNTQQATDYLFPLVLQTAGIKLLQDGE